MKKILASILVLGISYVAMSQKHHNVTSVVFANGRAKVVCLDTAATPEFNLYLDGIKMSEYKLTITDDIDFEAATKSFDMINSYRKENGLNPIKWDNNSYMAAKSYGAFLSHDMFFSGHHPVRKNNLGQTTKWDLGERLNSYCGEEEYGYAVENLNTFWDWEIVTEKNIFTNWRNSPSHNEGMLTPQVNHGAVAVYSTTYTFTIGDKSYSFTKKQSVMEFINKKKNYVYDKSLEVIPVKNKIIANGNTNFSASNNTVSEIKKTSETNEKVYMIKRNGKWRPQI